MTERRTMLAWFEYLDTPGREYTLSEFMALMLFHIRQHQAQTNARQLAQMEATEHIEGMLGALDQAMAAQLGEAYPSSKEIRAALDAHREQQRRLAEHERWRALDTGERA